jgi:hypothetical protein
MVSSSHRTMSARTHSAIPLRQSGKLVPNVAESFLQLSREFRGRRAGSGNSLVLIGRAVALGPCSRADCRNTSRATSHQLASPAPAA